MHPDLSLALSLADHADLLSLAAFSDDTIRVDQKSDGTPVTAADRQIEEDLRALITTSRPDHGVLGEEFGRVGGAEDQPCWVLDPIDGTKNFVRGIPVFASLIALVDNAASGGTPSIGVISAPAIGYRWWGQRDQGAWRSRFGVTSTIHVSAIDDLAEAQLSYDSVPGFEEHGLGDAFIALARRCRRTRAFGDFWSHMLVAEGAMDVAVEPEVSPWDVAAVQAIVEAAGGRFTDLRGRRQYDGGSAISTNGQLHQEVVAALAAR